MSRHDNSVYIRHMLDHARTAVGLATGKDRTSLDSDPMFRYASLHLISILGEAAAHVTSPGRAEHSEIPWRDIVGMRNMVIHGCDVVDLDVLWKTIEVDLPGLIVRLERILDTH